MERLTDRDMAGAIIDEADIQDVINKLYDYEEAEENGLLLRLPCKVGDTVYRINKEELNEATKKTEEK